MYDLNLPLDIRLTLFDQTITPILTYSSEIWGNENTDNIHAEFLRKITKLRKSTPQCMLYAES